MAIEFEVDFDLDTEDFNDSEKSFAEEWSITVDEDEVTIKSVYGHIHCYSVNLNIELSDGTWIVFKYKCDDPYGGRAVNTMTIDGDSVDLEDLEDDIWNMGWNLIDAIMKIYMNQMY